MVVMSENLIDLYRTNERFLMIRAPPGSGKTFSAIKYAIERANEGKRIGIFFRTRKQIEHALGIYWTLVRGSDNYPLAVPVVGKDKLCRFPPVNPEMARWWCAFIECEFSGKFSRRFLDLYVRNKPKRIDEIVGISFDSGGCPYQNVINAIERAMIVFATHPYFINNSLFEKLGHIDEAIIDEAHAFLLVKTAEISKDDYLFGKQFEDVELNRAGVALYREGKRKEAFSLLRFANFIEAPGDEIKIDDKIIKAVLPKNLIEERLKEISKIILLSATIYPESLFKRFFFPRGGGKLIIRKGILKGENKAIFALSIGLTTRFKERKGSVLERYAKVIKAISELAKPIVVFAPSYEIAEILAKKLNVEVSKEKLVESDIVVIAMRSRFAEGIELRVKGEEPKIGIIVGLPFPRLEAETRKLISFYAKKYRILPGKLITAYIFSGMISALIQAVGRIGRRRKGVVVIIDDRVKDYSLGIPIFENLNQLLERISKELL